ncbi:MAG TPA: NAD(P)-dependent oxidoreductase [Candidatus Nanoarchaeia archaeon]|nr:NAD(P)-dependent oxidoreductase [Candidatus Nanoarchaeia archaeon]
MDLFILSPNMDALFTKNDLARLQGFDNIILEKTIQPLENIQSLFTGNQERILAIDPDFCNWKFPQEIIAKIPHLKAICLQTTSFSWIDKDFAKKKGIPVTNLRGFSMTAVAEWAILMMFNVARKLPLVIKDGWKQDFVKHQGIELQGRTAGIIGLGNNGKAIAEKAQGLGMNIIYWSRQSRDKRFTYVELPELMKTADVIFPTTAQNEQTQGLLPNQLLETMKKEALFISTIHKIYDHEFMLQLVKKGKIYGYAFEEGNTNITKYEGNVWAGPELAWCTDGSMKKNAELWVESIIQAQQGKFPTQIN